MKKIIFSLFTLLLSLGLYSQNNYVMIGNTSNPNECDGWAYIDTSVVTSVGNWNYLVGDSTYIIQNGSYYVDGLCAGTYTVDVSLESGVSTNITFIITSGDTLCNGLNLSLISFNNASNANICDGSVYVQASNGSAPYTYHLGNNTSTSGEFGNLCSGLYNINVVDANGCIEEIQQFIDYNDSIENPCENFHAEAVFINPTTSFNVCDGSAEIEVFGGVAPYQYTLNNGTTTDNPNFSNLCSGWNWASVSDANGCFYSFEFYVISNDSTTNPCSSFNVVTETSDASGPNECNGSVTFLPYGGTIPYYSVSNGAIYPLENLSNLCPGYYTNTIEDSNGCIVNISYYIGGGDTTNQYELYVYAYPSSVSEDGICDGTVYFDIYGGTAPYTIVDENGIAIQQYQTGLCEGIYTAIVNDANGLQSTVTYFIASPDDIYDNGGYEDSTAIDTLYSGIVEDCIIDYLSLDSAYISNIEIIGNDSIVVTWSIITANGTTEIYQSYNISGWGVYEFILQVFCPQRASSPYFIVKQKVLVGYAGIKENTSLQFNMYPNPVIDVLHITLDEKTETRISILDLNGKVVFELNENSSIFNIPLNNVSNGNYIVKLENNKGVIYKKLVK